MLYGMADPIKNVLVKMGHRVRIYTPYGQLLPGMAYLVRRLLENTSNESFLRASFKEHKSEDQLLMNPSRFRQSDPGSRAGHSNSNHHATRMPGIHAGARDPKSAFRNEPVADFSREENREAMRTAFAEVAAQFNREYPLVINGEHVTTDRWMESYNPSNQKQSVGRFALARKEDAEAAIAAAAGYFPTWRDTPAPERAAFLFARRK